MYILSISTDVLISGLTVCQWNACVEFLPLWLAPNMVTLIGFFFIIANVVLLELVDPDLLGPKQSWVYYSYAAGVWAYSTR